MGSDEDALNFNVNFAENIIPFSTVERLVVRLRLNEIFQFFALCSASGIQRWMGTNVAIFVFF